MMVLGALCWLWAGMVLGISFLETPVKFTAPSVTLPIGLDIGRHVFGAFNRVEIGAAVVACACLFWLRPPRVLWFLIAVAAAIVALQSVWLLPVLDARVGLILAGQTPPPAPYHIVYILLELLKLSALLIAGAAAWRSGQPRAAVPF